MRFSRLISRFADGTNVIHILGYGRSGSTLLDLILSNHFNIRGSGELAYLPEAFFKSHYCSCSLKLSECPFWAEKLSLCARILNTNRDALLDSLKNFHQVPPQNYIKYLWKDSRANSELSIAYLDCLYQVLSSNNIFVDSSKCPVRFLNINRRSSLNHIPIIIFRNPLMSYKSVSRPFKKNIKNGIQTSYPGRSFLRFYITYNLRSAACLFICVFCKNSLLISYEHLTSHPSFSQCNLLGPEMHISAGSRIRFKSISEVLHKPVSIRDIVISFFISPLWPLFYIILYAKKNLLSDDRFN